MNKFYIFTLSCVGFILLLNFSGSCAKPTIIFSQERGFYYESFELTLSSSEGNILKYTLDGSDPLTSDHAETLSFPAVISINPQSNHGRALTPAVVLRACAINSADTGEVITQTYIFLPEVKYQPDVSPELAPYWPTEPYVLSTFSPDLVDWMRSNTQHIDLGSDPEVISKDEYFASFEPALIDIPSISIVTNPDNLFKDSTGIYTNATWHGMDWERPASVEFIYPDGDKVQSNAGLRMRGGFSRGGGTVKHSFRLFFRDKYGNGKFKFPLFEDEGTDTFDKIDIKSSQNNSWHVGNTMADFVHESFCRDIQGDMGYAYTKSRFYHLYVNGMYWGLYETQERPEANFGATYFGGDKEDYDVIKSTGPTYEAETYTLEATDGNLDAAETLWQIAKQGFNDANYYKVLGQNTDGTNNPNYPKLVDEYNLMDYMVFTYYSANTDAPVVMDGSGRINNFYGIYNRVNPDGFKFMVHDAENCLRNVTDNITNLPTQAGETFDHFNPMWLHQKLMENKHYREKFADRAYKLLYNNGVLTPDENIRRYTNRSDMINLAIIGESARWGDVSGSAARPYTRNEQWIPVIDYYVNTYFPERTQVVIDQFKQQGWLNGVEAPVVDENDFIQLDKSFNDPNIERFEITRGNSFKLINKNSSGTIYYALDGTDPRDINGNVSIKALAYSKEIQPIQTVFLKARVKDGDSWSPLAEYIIVISANVNVVISEVNYNPGSRIIGTDTLTSKNLEFIELKNFSGEDVDLSGFKILKGIAYEFPYNSIIKSDSLVVIAADPVSFEKGYGFAPFGQFTGNLNNDGEQLIVENALNDIIINFNYSSGWYPVTNGGGYSLIFADYQNIQTVSNKDFWRVSYNLNGSPGKDDLQPLNYNIKFNEVLANSDAPLTDAIELYNNSDTDVDISGWYLTDDKSVPGKWKIPSGTSIPTKGYLVFYEGHYVNDTLKFAANEFGAAFSVSSAGERLLLFSSSPAGDLGQFVCDYKVEPTDNNISFGDYTTASGITYQVQLDSQYFNKDNLKAYSSPVIFSTVMYHPVSGNYEYLVLKNRTDSLVNLYVASNQEVTWKVDGLKFNFPPGVSLGSGDSLYLIEKSISAEMFKSVMKLPDNLQAFNYEGKISNGGETLIIQKPVVHLVNDTVNYIYVNEELLAFSDAAPWPASADGAGFALHRINDEIFASEPTNWKVIYNTIPVSIAGTDQWVRLDKSLSLDGSRSYDPQDGSLTYQWQIVEKPEGSNPSLDDVSSITPKFTTNTQGEYLLSLVVSNSQSSSEPSYVSIMAYQNQPPLALVDTRNIITQVGSNTTISAARCYDPDYEPLNYHWELASIPDGSSVTLASNTSENLELTPDVAGKYKLSLKVDDDELFSDPISITVTAKPSTDLFDQPLTGNLVIYPNPANADLNIEFYLAKSLPFALTIDDLQGKNIYSRNLSHCNPGLNTLTIDLGSLKIQSGIYILHIRSAEGMASKKIIYTR